MIRGHHQRSSSEVIIRGHHQRSSSEVIIRGHHQRSSYDVFECGHHQRSSSEAIIRGHHQRSSYDEFECGAHARKVLALGAREQRMQRVPKLMVERLEHSRTEQRVAGARLGARAVRDR